MANDSDYGLSSGILTDFNRALDMAMRLETGMVHIGDQTVNDEPQVPFGGVKGAATGDSGASQPSTNSPSFAGSTSSGCRAPSPELSRSGSH